TERIEHLGSADDVHGCMARGFAQGLARSGLRRQVDHGVGLEAAEHAIPVLSRADISDDELDATIELCGPLAGRVNLRVQIVEGDYLGGRIEERRDCGADEACPTGDESAPERAVGKVCSGHKSLLD